MSKIIKLGEHGSLLVQKTCRKDVKCAICDKIIPAGTLHQAYQTLVIYRKKYYKDAWDGHYCLEHEVTQYRSYNGYGVNNEHCIEKLSAEAWAQAPKVPKGQSSLSILNEKTGEWIPADKIKDGIPIDYKAGEGTKTTKQLELYKQVVEQQGLKVSSVQVIHLKESLS